jgi:hypothetical protein
MAHVYQHLSRVPADFDYYSGYLDLSAPSLVRDRFHLSGLVYRCNDTYPCEKLDPLRYRMTDAAILYRAGAYVVVCAIRDEELVARYMTSASTQMYPLERVREHHATFQKIAAGEYVTCRGKLYPPVRVDELVHTDCGLSPTQLAGPVVERYLSHISSWDELQISASREGRRFE